MSSPSRPVPPDPVPSPSVRLPPSAPARAATQGPLPDGLDRDPGDVPDDWPERVRGMDPDNLRMLALSLPLIEQAKGILMGHYGCDAGTAFTVLRRWSASRQLKLRDLAAALVEEASRVDQDRDGQGRAAVARFLDAHGLG